MTDADAVLSTIDGCLAEVRRGLRGLSAGETADIIEELRSHIVDRARESGAVTPVSVAAAVAGLGDLRELASAYAAGRIAAPVEERRSPWWMLGAAFRLARLSVWGFFVFIASLLGYGIGASLVLTAVIKPFAPHNAGLWMSGHGDTFSLDLGIHGDPMAGQELLGWWIIPLGVILGGLLLWLTWRFNRAALRGVRRRSALRTTR
jgi:hypothetical protein